MRGKKREIDNSVLDLILEKAKRTNNLRYAIVQLHKKSIINPLIPIGTYINKLSNYQPCIEWRRKQENHRIYLNNTIKNLKNQGFENKEIAKKVGVNVGNVWKILKGYNQLKKVNGVNINKYKNIVKYWNDTKFNGKIPTSETIEAFKALKLEPPIC